MTSREKSRKKVMALFSTAATWQTEGEELSLCVHVCLPVGVSVCVYEDMPAEGYGAVFCGGGLADKKQSALGNGSLCVCEYPCVCKCLSVFTYIYIYIYIYIHT